MIPSPGVCKPGLNKTPAMTTTKNEPISRITCLIQKHIESDAERLCHWRKAAAWRWRKANDLLTDEDPKTIALDDLEADIEFHYAQKLGLRDIEFVLDVYDAALAHADWRGIAEQLIEEIRQKRFDPE